MATRRSRIKAVANLPARRNRPGGSNNVQKEDLESPEADDISIKNEISLNSSPGKKLPTIDKGVSHSGKKVPQESSIPSHDSSQSALPDSTNEAATVGDASTSEESQSTHDRRSVIVSDRKSVIVNRDNCISPTKLLLKDGLGKTDSEKPQSKSPNYVQNQSSDDAKNQHDVEGHDSVSSIDSNTVPIKLTEDKASESTEENTSISNKRLPLRSRRSKPAVNLTAATRKRTANDVTASPCSPPPVKLKSSEAALCHTSEDSSTATSSEAIPKQSLTSETKRISSSESTQNSLPTCSPPVTVPRPTDNLNGVFKTPVIPVSKNKDALNDSTNKGDVAPVSPQKELSNIKRKPSTNAQRVATARKNLKNRIDTDGTPPRSALTMFDLIFYNPAKNPMKTTGTPCSKSRRRLNSVSSIASIHEDRLNEESVDDIDDADTTQNNPEEPVEETVMPVPQVKVGPDGSLILDEQSLVIETTGAKKNREELEKSEVIVDSGTGYGHYKKIIRSKDWSDHETKKFYRALNVVGTDFSLMKPYFRSRTRRELKLKFKKEERLNPNLINKALADPLDFDISELEKECELEDEEKRLEELAKETAAEKSKEGTENAQDKIKKPAVRKKKKCIPLAEIGLETENSSTSEGSTPRKHPRKRKALAPADDEDHSLEGAPPSETENGSASETSSVRKKTKPAPPKKKKPVDTAEEDYNMLALGLDMSSQPVSPKRKEPTMEQDEMGIFAEPKTKPDVNGSKQPIVKRIVRKAPNLPQKPASANNSVLHASGSASVSASASASGSASSSSHPPTNFKKPEEATLKVPSTTLSTAAAVNKSTIQSQMSATPQAVASTSGFKLIQSSTQPQIQVVRASTQSVVPTGAFRVVQSTPQSRIQLVQSSPQATPNTLASTGAVTPKTYNIIRKSGSSVRPVSTPGNTPVSTPTSAMPVSALISSLSGNSTCLISSPGGKFVQSTPPSRARTVQVTPQTSSSIVGFGSTTPVERLLPSTPLPRMEPGSIIVLKTPLPQNPDQHVLQVYMVTNTPPRATPNTLSHSPLVPGINVLSGPTVQPANLKSPCMSEDSDSEKVLTTL